MEKIIKTGIACAILTFALSFQACKKDIDANAEAAFSSCTGGTLNAIADIECKAIGKFCLKYTRSYDQIGDKGMIYGQESGSTKLEIRDDHTLTIQAEGKSRTAEWEIAEISFQNDPKRYVLREKNAIIGTTPYLPSGTLTICDRNIMFGNMESDGSDFLYVRE